MKIIPLTQIRTEDFPKDQQKWLPMLLGPLNQFLSSVTTALQNNLDFSHNILGQEQNLGFTWISQASSLPLKFTITMKSTPNALFVCQGTENKNPIILNVAWQVQGTQLQITDISKTSQGVTSSLTVGASYTLRVRLWA
jgi:hypothetical protein